MRLTLRAWPPLASHLACLLAGVSLAHLTWTQEEPELKLPPRSLIMTLPPQSLNLEPTDARRGTKLALVQKSGSDTRDCRVTNDDLILMQREPVLALALGLDAARRMPDLKALARSQKAGPAAELRLIAASSARQMQACRSTPRIVYGRP